MIRIRPTQIKPAIVSAEWTHGSAYDEIPTRRIGRFFRIVIKHPLFYQAWSIKIKMRRTLPPIFEICRRGGPMCPPVMGTPNLSCVKTTKPFPVSLHIPSNHMQKCHPKRSEGPVHSGSILRKNFCKYTPSAQISTCGSE